MKIWPVVEGHGEIAALPVLLRRLLAETSASEVGVGRPIRRHRPQLVNETALRNAVRLAMLSGEATDGILIVCDADDDCPKHLGPQMRGWAKSEALMRPCEVVLANREFEAWFLASAASLAGRAGLRPDVLRPADVERPRDAKGAFQDLMLPGQFYVQRVDQPRFAALLDTQEAYTNSRSFRKLAKAVRDLLEGMGRSDLHWPFG